ncbi:MAG: cobalamin-binding protein [Magnetococcus sp. WYHC-3]
MLALLALLAAVADAQAAVSVIDDAGRTVTLERPAKRVVTLSPHAGELVAAAGGLDLLVGVGEHSHYPEALQHLPRVGDAQRMDLERVLLLHPDLVVVWSSGNTSPLVQRLLALVPAVFFSEPRQLEDIPANLRRLGQLVGRAETAEAVARDFESRLADLAQRYAGQTPVRVFHQVWRRPLITLSDAHMAGAVLRLCGGVGIFVGLQGLSPVVSEEAVLAADPQVIIIGSRDAEDPDLQSWRRWPQLAAVRLGGLVAIDPDELHQATPRILNGAQAVCDALSRVRQRLGGR